MHFRDDNSKNDIKKELGINKIKDLYSFVNEKFLKDNFISEFEFINHEGKSEFQVLKELEILSLKNKKQLNFLGGGAYEHFIPSIVTNLSSRSEFLTSYTPYQSEASQGTLQYIFEYQTLIAELFKMDVVNASHYDGAVSLAEATRMAYNNFEGEKNKAVISKSINPEYIKVIETYTKALEIEILFTNEEDLDSLLKLIDNNTFCLIMQNPNFFGKIQDIRGFGKSVNQKGALFILHTDPIFCSYFLTPGESLADICTAEGQPLGIDLSFGGPYLGIFTCKNEYLRKIPGRLSGETYDKDGNRGFVLTLATREQHIKREKSLSNLCTNQSLMALKAVIYLAYMGKSISEVALDCYKKTKYIREQISKISGFQVEDGEYFRDFIVKVDFDIKKLMDFMQKEGVALGIPLTKYYENSSKILITVTETKSIEDIDYVILKLKEFTNQS